jgi:hypothetical protein
MADFFREERLFIDGDLVQATGGRCYENINPASEEVIGVAADAGPEDIDRAIAAPSMRRIGRAITVCGRAVCASSTTPSRRTSKSCAPATSPRWAAPST